MKEKRKIQILFSFWIILSILAISWIIFNILFDFNIILKQSIYQFFIIFCSLSLIIAFFSIKGIIQDVSSNIQENERKESCIKDYYQYTQLLDPPELNN